MKVTKEVTFDAAHMLSGYEGKCHNLHGHTYKVQVSYDGPIESDKHKSSCGMVVDYNELKELMSVELEPFDHAIIFSSEEYRSEAESELFAWAQKYGMNVYIVPGKSTSECMAKCILDRLSEYYIFREGILSVRLWETPTSFCEVSNEGN